MSQEGNNPNHTEHLSAGFARFGTPKAFSQFASKGLTAIELLIITSVAAIITVFAAPKFNKTVMPSEFDRAIEVTESFVDHARATARIYNADVLMRIEPDNLLGQQSITLIIPKMKRDPSMMEVEEEFLLPVGFRLFSNEGIIHFNPNGDIAEPTHTLVLSNEANHETHQLDLQ